MLLSGRPQERKGSRRWASPTVALCAVFLVSSPASPAEPRTLIVQGSGQVDVRGDVLEINCRLMASGPIGSEALSQFRETQRRARSAIDALKIPQLSIETHGVVIGGGSLSRNVNRGFAIAVKTTTTVTGSQRQTTVVEAWKLKVAGVGRLTEDQATDLYAKTIDDLQQAKIPGLTLEGAGLQVEDRGAAQQTALNAAVANARVRANRLAAALGVKLGTIVHAQEQSNEAMPRALPTALSLGPRIPFTASVRVEFQIID